MSRCAQFIVLFVIVTALVCACEARRCTGGPNDLWTNCGSRCPLTCEKPKPRPCFLICVPDVCECIDGYYRREDGQCVTLEECKEMEMRQAVPYIISRLKAPKF